jgi:hypothetical protein
MTAPFAHLKVINYASWIAGPAAATILFGGYHIGLKPDAFTTPPQRSGRQARLAEID